MKNIDHDPGPEIEAAIDDLSATANDIAVKIRQRVGLDMVLVVVGKLTGERGESGMAITVGASMDPRDLPTCAVAIADSLRFYADQLARPGTKPPEGFEHVAYESKNPKRKRN